MRKRGVVSGVYHDREQLTGGSSPFDRPPLLSKATLTNTAEGTICSLSWLPPWVLIACYSSIMTWQGWSPRKWDRTMLPPKLTANWLHLLCSNFMGRLDPHRRMMGLRSFLCLWNNQQNIWKIQSNLTACSFKNENYQRVAMQCLGNFGSVSLSSLSEQMCATSPAGKCVQI